jgi:hypothetical protein
MRLRALIAVPGVWLGLCLGFGPAAEAHNASLYYATWAPADYTVDYYYTDNFPGARFRNRVWDGARQWNNLGRGPYFIQHLATRVAYSRTNAGTCGTPLGSRRVNSINWQSLDGRGGTLGVTQPCLFSSGSKRGHLRVFTLTFDSFERWYTRTGGAPANSIDAWSVASHELGHAMGSDHFRSTDPVCAANAGQQTMCPFYTPGSERLRTLGRHDVHTFNRVYPPR